MEQKLFYMKQLVLLLLLMDIQIQQLLRVEQFLMYITMKLKMIQTQLKMLLINYME